MQGRKLLALFVAAPLASPIRALAQPAGGPKTRFEGDLFSRLVDAKQWVFRMESQEKDDSRRLFAIDKLQREQ